MARDKPRAPVEHSPVRAGPPAAQGDIARIRELSAPSRADEFRDGDVPERQAPLTSARRAVALFHPWARMEEAIAEFGGWPVRIRNSSRSETGRPGHAALAGHNPRRDVKTEFSAAEALRRTAHTASGSPALFARNTAASACQRREGACKSLEIQKAEPSAGSTRGFCSIFQLSFHQGSWGA